MRQVPLGNTDFIQIVTQDMYYVDKTAYIEKLEQDAKFLMFLRPRRFGKSLLLNMLMAYYDVALKDQFDALFGKLYIGRHPTKLRNHYLILNFNFSSVEPVADNALLQKNFQSHCNDQFERFVHKYAAYFGPDFAARMAAEDTPAKKMTKLANLASDRRLQIYVFIDEYDNFANTILSSLAEGHDRYRRLTHGEGFFRTFFTFIKSGTTANNAGIDRIFLTGVSPLTLDDVTSGFNIATQISTEPRYNAMAGLTTEEVTQALSYYHDQVKDAVPVADRLAEMKLWYDNYCFSPDRLEQRVFNTNMVMNYLLKYSLNGKPPREMVDANAMTDYMKLHHLVVMARQLNGNFNVLCSLVRDGEAAAQLVERFSLEKITDADHFISLLFYMGLVAIDRFARGRTIFRIPNLTIREITYTYIVNSLEEGKGFRIDPTRLEKLVSDMAYDGAWQEPLEFIGHEIATQTGIRDFVDGEKVVQVIHLAYLGFLNYYVVRSEREAGKGYIDLLLTPNFHDFGDVRYSYVIELKYLKAGAPDAEVQAALAQAQTQLARYAADPQLQQDKGQTELVPLALVYRAWDLAALQKV